MFIREREVKGRTDVNYYTARRLGGIAELLNQLARAFDDGTEKNGQLIKDDGLAAMQVSATLVCENYSGCNLCVDNEKEDSYYLRYLLQTFEQKDRIGFENMSQIFQSGRRKKEGYLTQLNRSLRRATMNLSWEDHSLESRDVVMSQLGELLVILEEFSRQIDHVRDITDEYEHISKKYSRRCHAALGDLSLLEHEDGQKEVSLTIRTANGRCITSKDAVLTMGEVIDGMRRNPAKGSRNIITKQHEAVCFPEGGGCRMFYGTSRIPEKDEKYSGDSYIFYESPGNQAAMSLSNRMGSGKAVVKESKQVVKLTRQLLRAGFSSRVASRLVNTMFLLTGPE